MHDHVGIDGRIRHDLTHDKNRQASYSTDVFMNLDDNLFELDSESQELIFGKFRVSNLLLVLIATTIGRSDMDDNNHSHNQQYDPSAMQTDSDLNAILARMPTPVSNDIRATDHQNSYMSPLQVDQQGFDRYDNSFPSHRNEEVCEFRNAG